MNVVRKFLPSGHAEGPLPATSEAFGRDVVRTVALRCSSQNADREGDIVVQAGIDLSSYRRNPIILWQHRQDSPIARALEIGLGPSGNLECIIKFPEPGVSRLSDQVYSLIRAGIVKGVSIGYLPIEKQPLDRGNPSKGPQKYLQCELLEVSIVAVPSNRDGAVTWAYAEGGEDSRRKHVEASARRHRALDLLRLSGAR